MTTLPNTPPIDPDKLDKLAQVAVHVGLGLQKGQDLVMTAPLNALPLARKIVEHAYKAGAGFVQTIFSDEEITLNRYRYADSESFDRSPGWLFEGMAKAYAGNAARLAIAGDNPMLLAGQDPDKVSRANRAQSAAYKPAQEKIVNFDINWNIVAYPNASWAKQMFPDDDEDTAVRKLADAIFAASRVDRDDPVAAWAEHNATLAKRRDWMSAQNFDALHYSRAGHRPDAGARRRACLGGRRGAGQERHHLQRQHPDRGGVHDAAFAAGRWARALDQAAVASGDADREHRGAVRGRQDRRGACHQGRGRAAEAARHRRGRRAGWARWRWCRIRRRSRSRGCCSSTRCSTRTPRATSRSASATRRNASSTARS